MSDTKHGRVTPRPDGLMARCGGPGICTTCDAEREHEAMRTAVRTVPQIPTHASYLADVARAAHQTGKDLTLDDVAAVIEAVNSLAAPGVSTVEQDERSATHGMTLGERIAHVGGRTNAQGYIEFGSPMAVDALIQHVLRDIDCTRQEDDGAYQARYRLPGGQWSSWGHVVCGVKGHEQELRYFPAERRPAPAAPGVSTVEDPSFPTGAIVNGRTLADRLEAYPFQIEGGDLRLCADWVEFRRCFEYLAEWVGRPAPAAGGQPAPIKLVHLAVAEDGGVRFMTGRKLPQGIESCELYAMPDYGRAPAELFRAPAAGDALDAARLDWLERHDGRFYNKDRISSIVGTGFLVAGDEQGIRHQTVRAAIDAAIAAQRKGNA
ncbi:hypothetical protein [Achromobacter xylosoxidans]|uniref:hypothetical protein n=1 Tax=Alcaligenes xylosoxydans xylosoxydans TaxID=85698 RepID=UPI001EEE9099|nr:hypothetical protein [Achromobacter xylosoxidans]